MIKGLILFFILLYVPIQGSIDDILQSPRYKDITVGIVIKNMSKKKTDYAKNDTQLFIPASTIKVLLSAASIQYLGRNHQFDTFLLTDGKIKNKTLMGNLYLVGKGDPTLSDDDLQKFITRLQTLGIETISGNLIYDDTYFKQDPPPETPEMPDIITRPPVD